jgi:hypothetical protein
MFLTQRGAKYPKTPRNAGNFQFQRSEYWNIRPFLPLVANCFSEHRSAMRGRQVTLPALGCGCVTPRCRHMFGCNHSSSRRKCLSGSLPLRSLSRHRYSRRRTTQRRLSALRSAEASRKEQRRHQLHKQPVSKQCVPNLSWDISNLKPRNGAPRTVRGRTSTIGRSPPPVDN